MNIGKTIRIYLADGSVSGIRHAEIVNWTGQAISAPRSQIKELKLWEESQKPGVYFLFGADEDTEDTAVYIGEAENVFSRLSNHVINKDFWNDVIFFTNKDENLTKSHIKYLESRLCELAKNANRYPLKNGNEPQMPVLPRGDRDAMEEFIENINILLGVLGHRVLEPYSGQRQIISKTNIDNNQDNIQLHFSTKDITAKAVRTDEGIVVLANSYATLNIKDSLAKGYAAFRENLINKKVLVTEGKKMKFTKDQLFSSSSQAAAIIAGYPISGPGRWKTSQGLTLKEVEEEQLSY